MYCRLEEVREGDVLIELASFLRFTRVLVVLLAAEEEDGRVVIPLLFSFRMEVPWDVDGRPERLLYRLLSIEPVDEFPSPLKEEADPLFRLRVELL